MISDSTLMARCSTQLDNAIGARASDAINETRYLIDRYYGRPFHTDETMIGRSQVTTREAMEVIEWMIPSLMRIFASGERVVEFVPENGDDVQQAEQETDVVNHLFLSENDGWALLQDVFRSSLRERMAYVKVTWDHRERRQVSTYTALNAEQAQAVLEGQVPGEVAQRGVDRVEVMAQESIAANTGEIDALGQPIFIELYNLQVREVTLHGFPCVEFVPREEVRVSKDARSVCLDGIACVGHVRRVPRTDLRDMLTGMGVDPDIVETLSAAPQLDPTSNSIVYSRQVERGAQRSEYFSTDESTALVEVRECWIRIDADEDGTAELRRVMYADNTLLVNEEADEQPMVAFAPYPMPAVHVGQAVGDHIDDVQRKATDLWRGILDNIALTNSPEKEIDVNKVAVMEDFLQTTVGGLKRVKELGAVRELTVPFAAGASIPVLEMIKEQVERRTGVTEQAMGVDADTLNNSTLGAFTLSLGQANQRIEMVARTYAEMGVRWMFTKMRGLVTKHQSRVMTIKLRDEFVEVDPRDWANNRDTTVNVGLGTGGSTEAMRNLDRIAAKQEEHIEKGSPMVGFEELSETYRRMVERSGYKNADAFFASPGSDRYEARKKQREEAAQAKREAEQGAVAAQADAVRAQIEVAAADVQSRAMNAMRETERKAATDMAKLRAEVEQDRRDMALQLNEAERKWADMELQYRKDILGHGVQAAQVVPLGAGD